MKTNIATDSSQSRRLLRCGVSADTADMSWVVLSDDTEILTAIPNLAQSEVINYPAWSLSALLELLPFKIHCGNNEFWLNVAPMNYGKQWSIGYYCTEKPRVIKGLTHTDSLIECAVQEIEWLTANGYKLNEQ